MMADRLQAVAARRTSRSSGCRRAEDVYLFHGVARENPKDERLFALAEVRDLTPVRDEDGRLTALPGVRADATSRRSRRIRRYPGPPRRRGGGCSGTACCCTSGRTIDLAPEEMTGAGRRASRRAADGLGLEMLLVHGRLREADGVVRDRVLRFFSPTGTRRVVEVDDPPQPLRR